MKNGKASKNAILFFRVESNLRNDINFLAKRDHTTKSAVVRRAVADYMKRLKDANLFYDGIHNVNV